MIEELKPCPFCGLPVAKYHYHEWGYGAECGNPDCPMYENESIKVDAWNTRPIEDRLTADLTASNELCERLRTMALDLRRQLDEYQRGELRA